MRTESGKQGVRARRALVGLSRFPSVGGPKWRNCNYAGGTSEIWSFRVWGSKSLDNYALSTRDLHFDRSPSDNTIHVIIIMEDKIRRELDGYVLFQSNRHEALCHFMLWDFLQTPGFTRNPGGSQLPICSFEIFFPFQGSIFYGTE